MGKWLTFFPYEAAYVTNKYITEYGIGFSLRSSSHS